MNKVTAVTSGTGGGGVNVLVVNSHKNTKSSFQKWQTFIYTAT